MTVDDWRKKMEDLLMKISDVTGKSYVYCLEDAAAEIIAKYEEEFAEELDRLQWEDCDD